MKLFRKHKPVVIFSVSTATSDLYDDEGAAAIVRGTLHNNGVPYKQLMGARAGKGETSFLVPDDFRATARYLASKYRQDYMLLLDEYRYASLYNLATHEYAKIGHFHPTYRKLDVTVNHTYDPDSGVYYIIT